MKIFRLDKFKQAIEAGNIIRVVTLGGIHAEKAAKYLTKSYRGNQINETTVSIERTTAIISFIDIDELYQESDQAHITFSDVDLSIGQLFYLKMQTLDTKIVGPNWEY